MSSCPDCGNRDGLCRRCRMDELESRHGAPTDEDGSTWVLGDEWHASMWFDRGRHTCACGATVDTPLNWTTEDLRYVPDEYDAPVCEGCIEILEETDDSRLETLPDGGEFERASKLRADGGRDPDELVILVCEPCDYQTVVARGAIPATSCPDCQGDLEIDDDHVAHKCPDGDGFNHVTVGAGERCPFCQTVQKRPVATDGGTSSSVTEQEFRGRIKGKEVKDIAESAAGSHIYVVLDDGEPYTSITIRGEDLSFEITEVRSTDSGTEPNGGSA